MRECHVFHLVMCTVLVAGCFLSIHQWGAVFLGELPVLGKGLVFMFFFSFEHTAVQLAYLAQELEATIASILM
jgi:hypothetical protein